MGELTQYYVFFTFIIIAYFILGKETNYEFRKNLKSPRFLLYSIIALWILVGTRDVLYGRDTLGYVVHFKRVTSFNWDDNVEPFFALITYLTRSVTSNYHVYLIITSLPLCVALFYLLKRYFSDSFEVLAAICIFTLLGLLAFQMAAMRQCIALALGIAAFIFADKDDWKSFLCCVGIAYLFHNSSFVLIAIYPMKFLRLKFIGIVGVIVMFLVGAFFSDYVAPFIQMYIPSEDRFSQYGTTYESSQNYTGFILQLILVSIAYSRRKYLQIEEKTQNLFFNTAYTGMAIQSLTLSLAELYRVSFYFCIFDIVLVPLALSTFKFIDAKIYRLLFILGCLFYIFVLSGGGVLPRMEEYTYNIEQMVE